MADIEKSGYFIHRQNLRLLEDNNNVFSEAHRRRHELVLKQFSSIPELSNDATCSLYKNDFSSYASLVDARGEGKVNNYADAAVNLVSSCKNDPKEWKSTLHRHREKVIDLIKNLKCQNCANSEEPKQLSRLFLESSNNTRIISSPPRARKSTQKGLTEFYKLVSPKDVNSPVSSTSDVPKPEGQGLQFQPSDKPDYVSLGKNAVPSVPQVPQVQPYGRPQLNSIKNTDEQFNVNKNFHSRAIPSRTVADSGSVWSNTSANPPKDYLNNAKRDFGVSGNNFDKDYHGYGPPSREFDRNSRGGGSGGGYARRGGRDYGPSGARQSADNHYRNVQEHSDGNMSSLAANFFKTARDELVDQNAKKNNGQGRGQCGGYDNYDNGYSGGSRGGNLQYGAQKRSLGTARRGGGIYNKFVPPVRPEGEEQNNRQAKRNDDAGGNDEVDERLKNIDPKMIELIKNEIMDISAPVCWDDIAGLEFAKSTIQEIVVWPMMRPDIFTGLRKPPKGLLLFGPPGTGKTLIGKCIASQSQSTFFSISASSLTSKWIGDGEKMVRALFAVAKCHQPAVVFIDEIDSLLTQRSDTEHESSRRIKTEFLVQLDGAGTGEEERILVVGATNRPQELDEAARRRLVKRLYIPLPEFEARRQIVERLMSSERNDLSPDEVNEVARLTDGHSGADMKNVCQEASLGPIRSLSFSDMHQISAEQVRPVNFQDFKTALSRVRASVSQKDLEQYVIWDQTYGMSGGGL